MIETCKICGQEVKSDRHFSAKHGINQKEYYLRYWPRRDQHDGTKIDFKDKESYLAAEFNNKTNMAAWLAAANRGEAEKCLLRLFNARVKIEQWKFAPCSVELRTNDHLPSLTTIEKVVGSYGDFVESLGLINRFPLKSTSIVKGLKIAIDTREQQKLTFKNSADIKLDIGDYSVVGEGFSNVFIDRKNPSDCIGTFTKSYDRFSRELLRAKSLGAYIVVLVEKPLSFMRSFDSSYLKQFTQVTPKYLFSNIRKMLQEFDNVQFVFAEEKEAAKIAEKILGMGTAARQIDLQQWHDGGRL